MRCVVWLALLACGCGPPCKASTVFLAVRLMPSLVAARALEVVLSLDGAPAQRTTLMHDPTHASDTLEIDVPGYRAGAALTARIDAILDGVRRGSGSVDLTLASGCTHASLVVAPLSCPSVLTSANVFVDPLDGSDDRAYGGGPGVCANQTLTFASQYATGAITLAPGTYQRPAETFPIKLNGTQLLDCHKATLLGSGLFGPGGRTATLLMAGEAVTLHDCTITAALNTDACVVVSGPGSAPGDKIESSALGGCMGSDGHGAAIEVESGSAPLTLTDSTLTGSFDGVRWLGDGHTGAITGVDFGSLGGADVTCPDGPNANVTGSGNQHGATPCSGCANCPL